MDRNSTVVSTVCTEDHHKQWGVSMCAHEPHGEGVIVGVAAPTTLLGYADKQLKAVAVVVVVSWCAKYPLQVLQLY